MRGSPATQPVSPAGRFREAQRRRRIAVALVAGAIAIVGALPAFGPPVASAAGLKVVVIVGPVESLTSTYRSWGEKVAVTAASYGADVRRVYSPNATWQNVLDNIQGASIVVYLGHGNGFPNPYSSTLNPYKVDGFGLNDPANPSDYSHIYYGEYYIRNSVRLAPNAVVFLNHACYAPGASESWDVDPTLDVARQRADNFASGFVSAGARAVFALGWADPSTSVAKILTGTNTTMKTIFETASDWTGTWVQRFASVRSAGFDEELDPTLDGRLSPPQPTMYQRSLLTWPGLTAAQVRGLDSSTPSPTPAPTPTPTATASPTASPTPSPASGGPSAYNRWVKVTSGPVNVRSGPATTYSILGQYALGTDFYAAQLQPAGGAYTGPDGATHTDWVSTTYSGLSAWVARAFTADDGSVQMVGTGCNIRTGPGTSFSIYAYTTTTSIVRSSDGAVLGPLTMALPLSGYVSGGSYTVGGVTGSTWAKIYLDGGWRYVAQPLVKPSP